MLGQRRRRWRSINPALRQRLVSAGRHVLINDCARLIYPNQLITTIYLSIYILDRELKGLRRLENADHNNNNHTALPILVAMISDSSCCNPLNPLTAKLKKRNFHPLEVVSP